MATKDCTFFVDIDGRQVEMDFDGFRAYLMQDGVMATLAPDLTKKRGQKAGFTVTAQKAEPTPARAEAAKTTAEPFKVDVGGVEGQGYAFSRQTKASLIENVIKGGEYITDFTVFAVRAAIRPKGLKHVKDAEQTRPAPDIVRDRWENTYIKAAQEPANIVGVWSLNKRIDIALIQSGDMIVPLNARDLKALYELVEFDALKVAKGDPTSPVIALKNGQPVGMTAPFHGDMLEQTYRVTPDKLRGAADQIQQTLGTPAEPAPARAEAPKARAEGTTQKTEAPAPTELEVSAENLRKLMPKLSKARAEAIIAVMKAMGIPFDRLKLAKGKVEAKGTLQQADTKARDAEYMAAVKAGDTAKAQRMVEEAAKAAGYTTGPVEHGSGARFTQFKPEFQGTVTEAKSTSGAWFFTDGTRTAKGYAVYAAEEGPIKQLMRQAEAAERKGDWDTYERLIQQAEDAVYGEEGAAATAERRKNAVVYKGFLRGKFKTIDAQGETPATLSASEDFVEFDGSITAAISAAKRQGFDGLIIQNLDDAPGVVEVANHFVVWDSSQFKSADPITYDNKGNVIPLSQRFKAESPDIRYQGEAFPLGSITFIDDLNALISVFEKANFSTVIHEAMHFYRRHMLNTENGFTADEIKRFERWAGAKDGKWTVAAEEKAARAFEKYLRDGLAPIPELRDLFRKVARWMREVYATLTGSPVDIDIPADIRQVFDRIFTLEAERQGKAGGQAAPAAGTQSLQQADTKARDAEYMAAVKAGDTAKAQKMVEEAAKAAGYNTPKLYHGTPSRFYVFDASKIGSNGRMLGPGFYFTTDKDTALGYTGQGGRVVTAYARSMKPLPYSSKPFNASQMQKLLTSIALIEANSEPGGSWRDGFLSGYVYTYGVNLEAAVKEASRAFLNEEKALDQLGGIIGSGVDPAIVNQGLKASLGYDSYTATGYENRGFGGGDIYVLMESEQVKSADPVTYDDKGNVIPLSQRFKPESPDIRYQREGEGVPQAETATAAYRRAMKERQQEGAAEALRRLGQKKGEPATFVSAQPRPSLEITPVNRRAVIETMQELREFKRKLMEQKGGLAAATDADLDKWEKLLNRVEQLGGVNPITPQMDAKYDDLLKELQISDDWGLPIYRKQLAFTNDKFMASVETAAKTAFGIPYLVAGGTHDATSAQQAAEELLLDKKEAASVLKEQENAPERLSDERLILAVIQARTGRLAARKPAIARVVKAVLASSERKYKGYDLSNPTSPTTWEADLTDYLEGRRRRFLWKGYHHAFENIVQAIAADLRAPTPIKATSVFQTGKPVLATVYRGGLLTGNEFQEQFLGAYTKAPSAKMGYFFAGRRATSAHYSIYIERYIVAMYNPLVYDYKGNVYREASLAQVVSDAFKNGHDGVIAVNFYDPKPIDNVFVIPPGGENRIKSYGLTYDSEGNDIPLSERFNPTTKNVLYQGEDPLPNPEGTSTEAFRRKQAEQRQKNLIDAMNRLRQGQAQAPKGEPKAAQPKAAKEPSQARQAQTTAPRAAKTAASTPRRGFGGKSLDDIFDALLKQAKAGQLGVSKEAPATPSELLEERIKRGLRDVLDAVYNKRVQPESAVDTARNAAANLLAAHQAGEQSAIDAATAEFRQVVSESRKAARGPQAPRPPRPKATVAERYAKMMGRINEKPKPAAKATPAELAEMTVRQLLRRMEKQLKVAKSQGIDVEQMEVNGTTVSRKEFFVNAADEYQDAYVKQDVPRQQAAYDRMRMAVDTIVTSLQKGKSRPNWHGIRSPLSYANVIGSYEAIMGQLGAEISELFKRTRTDINNKVMTFSEGMSFLQEQMNKVYKPLMKAQGYYGMPAIIDEHIKYLRFTAAFSARYMKIRQEQSIFKDPKAWYTTRRELSRELIDGQSAAFPMAAAMIKSVVYTAKLKYNLKSASTNYISLALSVGPYMRANELADIIYEAAKPSTWNRKVAGDRTLRDVAVGETGGRQASGAPADEGLTHWWHRKDIFQLSSEHVRIAGYLVGERMAEREDQKLRAEGKAPLSDYVKARLIRDWIEKVEFDNSPWNIAPLFRGPVASVAFQFKPFLQKNVERFIADLQRDPEAFVLSDPRTPLGQITNKIPWKYRRVIGTIGQQVMWGGIGSLLTAVPYLKPLAGVFILAGLMNALKGMTDDDEFAEDLAVAIYYGAPAAIGTDLSSSVGFFEEPYGKTVHEQAVNFFLGPLASTALNVVQEDIKFLETAQKEPRLGGEEEKRKEMLRRGINIAKQVTPYVRMVESAVDLAQGEGSTMRLDKEEKLTKWETAIRALGGAPIKQTMFFDEKEAYGWQKSLLGKPTGFERLKKKEGESDASYFRRKAKTDQWERTYLRRLEQNPRYRRLKPEEQEAVRENLWRNFAEESGKLRPDTSKFDASGLLERRAERVRSR